MLSYRVRLKQLSGSRFPLHSDTLWGQLCWLYRDGYGESSLAEMLSDCRCGNIPFCFSDGFPAGYLPIPAGGAFSELPVHSGDKKAEIERMNQIKAIKRLQYLSVEQFERVINGERIDLAAQGAPPDIEFSTQTHNSIDRITNTVTDSSLYQETLQYAGEMDLYVYVRDDFEDILFICLEQLFSHGFGGGASRGLGAFECSKPEEIPFFQPASPNCYITLSRCTPAKDMPLASRYKTTVKFGKHGQERSKQDQPYKKAAVQFEPGAVFWGTPPPDGICGTLIEGISYHYPDTVQCGYSIAVSARIDLL